MIEQTPATKIEYAQRAYWVLREHHAAGKTITHSELAERIEYPYATWHRHWGDVIGMVALEDLAIARCVVRKDTGMPSPTHFRWEEIVRQFHRPDGGCIVE